MHSQVEEHQRAVARLAENLGLLERMAQHIEDCFDRAGKLYLLGNGGSAADAQHIAAELVGRFKKTRKALPAIALTTDTSILTAVTNDLGQADMFSRQVEALVTRHDSVWALSVSGRSVNVLRGLEAARAIGAFRIGFTGRTGMPLRDLCDLCLLVDHEASDRVQEIHQLAYHLICDHLDRRYAR